MIRGCKLLKLKRFTRFWKLRNDEKTALIAAAVALAASALALRTLGLKRTLKLLSRVPRGGSRRDEHDQTLTTEAQAVDRASRATGMGTCLSKSLALYLRLRRKGIDARLRIGVAKGGGALSAHAWLERDGLVINGGHETAGSYPAFPPIEVGRIV